MLNQLAGLWLPIILAAAAVWFWAFLSWAAIWIHKVDFDGVPDEEGLLNALRPLKLPTGVYTFPHCRDHAQQKDPAFVEKWKTGPTGMLYIFNPSQSMGINMLSTFVVYLIASFFIAYVGVAAGLPRGAAFPKVLQVLGVTGILTYSFASLPTLIWFQSKPAAKFTFVLDGVVSGLATGLIFAALW